ncbi:hypothetical protein AvCA_01030 [Azotobacter vinelandii CA]|uniref:Uncharacterized protein n=2 Tax=Azotobacter vinelandii TaxID=354 RepID=C1DG43_AZOVD|nr:hypothetical protein Avin_01030 [Azotobacter vinelandii DJ]AGK15697.1 hypothetical protein AvCA_01030 [Azotobacter vinelandii CA]AGK19076.1 hypothetical protein AvCA6_01030 [Azotobacter vinelandii CA6]
MSHHCGFPLSLSRWRNRRRRALSPGLSTWTGRRNRIVRKRLRHVSSGAGFPFPATRYRRTPACTVQSGLTPVSVFRVEYRQRRNGGCFLRPGAGQSHEALA